MWIGWRSVVVALSGILFAGAVAQADVADKSQDKTILVVGDSLSAEYGLRRGSGWVELLARRLHAEQQGYQIRNTSISGDTSSGGVARLPEALRRHQPAIVIIELGSNDALRGLSLQMTRDNLAEMMDMARQARAQVLLVGMQIPPNYGRKYAEQFQQLFPEVAQQHGAALVPFLLEGMATDRSLFQPDGIHPNEEAQALLERNVWRQLEPMLTP
ncbi:MAG TPA: arylesterase [Burkholderiaceae bacterium]|nr:arylesterase [Burkholderiaceae bacterium]